MYDNFSKFLIDEYPQDFSSWLLGEPIAFTELLPKELSIEPVRADSMILLESLQVILHLEFQTDPDTDMPYRMADYALRIYRKFPDRKLVQVVIYLRKTTSPKVNETRFAANNLVHEFRVVRLWEQETEIFLRSPGLLPYAALTKTDDREGVLREVARRIEVMENRREQANLMTISAVMSALSLENNLVQRIFRRNIMEASPMYHQLKAWAREDAERELRLELADEIGASVVQERQLIALNMFRKNIPLDTIAEVTGLTLEQLQELGGDR